MSSHTIRLVMTMSHGLGLMALLGAMFGTVERLPFHPTIRSVIQGSLFGLGAILAMLDPVQINGGIILDSRSIIVGLAAAFCGLPAAVMSAGIAIAFRLCLGGGGVFAGAAGILLAAGIGLAWARWVKPARQLGLADFAILGVLVSLYVFTFGFLPFKAAWNLLIHAAPAMTLTSVCAALVLGSFIERERRHIGKESHWQFSAMTDALTGLANRRSFEATLELVELGSGNRDFAVLIVDADHFKTINDTYGHLAGDAALRTLAGLIQASVRTEDSVCRIGGEEFAVILPNVSPQLALLIAARIRAAVEAAVIAGTAAPLYMTVSIGAAMASEARTMNTSIVSRADAALYEAKKNGRNRVVGLTPRHEAAMTAKVRAN